MMNMGNEGVLFIQAGYGIPEDWIKDERYPIAFVSAERLQEIRDEIPPNWRFMRNINAPNVIGHKRQLSEGVYLFEPPEAE